MTEYSEDHDFIVLGARERADVLVTPTGESGGKGLLRSLLHDRGYGSIFGRDFESLFTIRFADEPTYDPGARPARPARWSPTTSTGRPRSTWS